MLVLFMSFEVLSELADATGDDGDLHFWTASVFGMSAMISERRFFSLSFHFKGVRNATFAPNFERQSSLLCRDSSGKFFSRKLITSKLDDIGYFSQFFQGCWETFIYLAFSEKEKFSLLFFSRDTFDSRQIYLCLRKNL
jgi:hypothetical protein